MHIICVIVALLCVAASAGCAPERGLHLRLRVRQLRVLHELRVPLLIPRTRMCI